MGSSSGLRSDCFPVGLRVLVVDDDPAWLKILEKMLIKCKYQVTICNLAQEALDLLEKRKDGFDIVISDVNVPDMDGFMFLEQVGLKMDLPVIMMSVDGETRRVMKGVQHGACDYLLKPIRMKELRNIWQHVFRKRVHEVRGGGGGGGGGVDGKECSLDQTHKAADASCSFSGGGGGGDLDIMLTTAGKKRKDHNTVILDDNNNKINNLDYSADPSSLKKPRVVWTVDLHQKFVKAVNRIGLDKVGPKKILDLMGVPWLTRENVASHLQKYRLYLSRLQKENDLKAAAAAAACGGNGMKLSDFSSSENTPSSLTLQQNIVINENYVDIHSQTATICEGNVAGILSLPEAEKVLFGDVVAANAAPISSSSRIAYNQQQQQQQPFELQVKSESKIQAHYTWSGGGAPSPQFKQQQIKPHFQFDHFPLVPHGQREADHQPMEPNINHFYSKNRSYAIGTENTATAALLNIPQQSHFTHRHTFEDQQQSHVHNNLESSFKNMIVGTGSAHRLRDVELSHYSHAAGDICLPTPHLVNMESFGCSSGQEELVGDARPEMYDSPNFEDEYGNAMECYVTSQGLYFG